MSTRKERNCPLCEKKGIKYLSAHLKNKHKILDVKERASFLKRSLNHAEETEVKHNGTVPSENGCGLDEFHEQERILGASFQDMEDRILKLRLHAMQSECSEISEQCFRLEIRAKLLPLYGMVMKSLETLLLVTPQMKRVEKEETVPKQSSKRKRKSDVQNSYCGMDYLKNGLVRCQLCRLTWDGNAQHDCPYDADGKLL